MQKNAPPDKRGKETTKNVKRNVERCYHFLIYHACGIYINKRHVIDRKIQKKS